AQWFTPCDAPARSVDVLGQEPGSIGYPHEASGLVDVHHVGTAGAQHHIHPEEVDAECPPAAPGNLTELRAEAKRVADLVLVGTERPDPPHPEQPSPNAEDLEVTSIRLDIALSHDRCVRRESGQLAHVPDDPDALPTGSLVRLDDERAGLEKGDQIVSLRR